MPIEPCEHDRLMNITAFERPFWARGLLVAGIDEAGRGPLAGPVVAAVVIMPPEPLVPGIDDSKRLTPEQRENLCREILNSALAVGVGQASPQEIDRLNILRASHLAMQRATEALGLEPHHLFVDGPLVPVLNLPQTSLAHGDQRCYSVAAASIVAKVTRDRIMAKLDLQYPGYGFAKHKGYPTRDHVDALLRLGPSPVHRRSFHVPQFESQVQNNRPTFEEHGQR